MAGEKKSAAAHRHYLLCPVCLRTQESLSCHLRRVCMKDKTPPEILEVVEKAKKDVCDLLKNGRAFSYAVLKQIVSSPNPLEGLIEELKYHHLFVTGVPPPLPIGNPRLVTETLSECPGEAPGETEPSDVESCGSNELFQCRQEKTYTKDKMVKAKALGILKKHSADHPLLKRFADYLKNDYENAKYQQEVDTVSRYLYFADPTEPSLKFVNDREKLRDFLGQQAKAGYKAQTSGNYIKCLKRFLEFHLTRTGLRQDDRELYKQCTLYLSFLTSSQSVLSKQASKEIVQKRHALLFDKSQPTPRECLAVLDKGEGDLVKIMDQLDDSSSSSLSRTECIFVLYYLEAIVILRHCQRPCVVQSMKVKEWLERKHADDDSIVFVKDHKTAAHFVVSIVLSKKEEAWFEKYYTKVRPQLLAGERKRKRDEQGEKDGDDFFFVSSRGKPIYNAAGDLIKLQQKCNVPQVSSQVVRRVFETAANRLDDPQKKAVSDYLAHSGTTADKHYRMKSLESIVMAAGLLKKLQKQKKSSAGPSGQEALGEGTSPQSVESSSHGDHCALPQPSLRQLVIDLERIPEGNNKVKFHKEFKSLLEKHPVTLSGQIPKMRHRRDTSEANQRKLYTHWAEKQLEMRVKHTREQFNRRRPTKERVDTWVKKQGWKCKAANISTEVVENWAPSGSEDRIMDNKQIQTLVKTQDWKGLHITQFEEKGDGIITTRTFKKGEVVCDYHGPVVSGKEGENIHKNTTGKETGYIFFFRNSKGQSLCIDAHSDRCHCHPDKRTFGRLLNHSKKNSNIKPLHCVVDKDGEMKDVILFIATKDLPVGEEVLFDYGVNKKYFNNEGSDLDWL
ncbi:uncharacterized protein LOC130378769 isoform X1 [Gadus chalcogrammus]|uniref:uncharacterized protein LOC130378769 isoform X1 n=3 Tax=Gadus chalcogrammus TaxID=1042646 RepID=UPI0024C3971F|nr:uncharacterized protein LOC130378769 isoform X1 [Gadus chalcogrammus]